MSKYIHKSHNVSVLLYHIVCPAKYRRVVFREEVIKELVQICEEITDRYEIEFIEIAADRDNVHFLVQSIPMYSPTKLVRMIRSLTAHKIFERVPGVKEQLWGGEFWSKGYYIGTVGRYSSEETIKRYLKEQGRKEEYKKLYSKQLKLF